MCFNTFTEILTLIKKMWEKVQVKNNNKFN